MKITCAIFDFDGTLFDSMFIWDSVGENYLRSLGKVPRDTLREDLRPMSLRQSAAYLIREYDLNLVPEAVMAGINGMIDDFYMHQVLPKPGVPAFLEALKQAGVSMCIATASERSQIEAALTRCSLDHYFEAIFTCGEVGQGKDAPIIFRRAMEEMHGDRSNTVVFEDAFHAARTAKEDGFTVAAVFDESEPRQAQLQKIADCYLRDFEHTEPFWRIKE